MWLDISAWQNLGGLTVPNSSHFVILRTYVIRVGNDMLQVSATMSQHKTVNPTHEMHYSAAPVSA